MSNGITAKLVYDGGEEVHIPSEMGTPRADQMQGTPAERLVELAGRVCYDSLGKGRPSFSKPCPNCGGRGFHSDNPDANSAEECDCTGATEGYHDHILSVGHLSVLEHFNFTAKFHLPGNRGSQPIQLWAVELLNRPGVFSRVFRDDTLWVTCNIRAVIEWASFHDYETYPVGSPQHSRSMELRMNLAHHAYRLSPHIVQKESVFGSDKFSEIETPNDDNCRWLSLFLSCSRGCSHELVRHGDFTAISQRSTRYVDESESPWIEHPLTRAFMDDHAYPKDRAFGPEAIHGARLEYGQTAKTLEHWLLSRGVDKSTARKQARGAARGYLGNALQTELIFSANVAQWKRMLRQRASVFADAEIRELFCKVLAELKRSRWGECFEKWELRDSPDGIGQVAVEVE